MTNHTLFPPALPSPNSDDSRPLPELIAERYGFPLAYHDVEGVRYYAVQDWILGVAQPSHHPGTFWTDMKRRMKKAGTQFRSDQCLKLPYKATDNKYYQTDHCTQSALNTILQFMRKAKPSRSGQIYLFHYAEFPGVYKIGQSEDVHKRCASLASQTPFIGVVDHVIQSEDRVTYERLLHSIYRPYHFRNEWFALDDNQIQKFRALKNDHDIQALANTVGCAI